MLLQKYIFPLIKYISIHFTQKQIDVISQTQNTAVNVAIKLYFGHHKANSKKNSMLHYLISMPNFNNLKSSKLTVFLRTIFIIENTFVHFDTGL